MIPKIIHYTWFSGDPMPKQVEECLSTWHQLMPDWEFRLWDLRSVQGIDSIWLRECLESRKWAFASDYVRLYALHFYGGIYLDTDCALYKTLEPLRQHRAFIGREWQVHIEGSDTWQYLTSHCMGAEPGHPYIKRCLDYYSDRHFVLSSDTSLPDNLRYDQTLLPYIQCMLAMQQGYNPSVIQNHIQSLPDGLTIYPYNYLDCFEPKSHSYARHLALGSWWRTPNPLQRPHITLLYRIQYRLRQWFRRFMWRRGYIVVPKK